MTIRSLTAVITHDGEWYVAHCPEVDIVSQGTTVEEARAMLTEALELFFETALPEEVAQRTAGEVYITNVEVAVSRGLPELDARQSCWQIFRPLFEGGSRMVGFNCVLAVAMKNINPRAITR